MNAQLEQMRRAEPVGEMLNRAFELAYFILGDRAASIYVAMAAMDKLKAASNNQLRRSHYHPTGRSAYPATRTKISLSDLHLLQRLVYVESELFERLIEGQATNLHQEDMIIRYIKHLVRITTKHNSFYVTLGLARLLYNYRTADTSEIYNLVIQDPDRIRDDYYYRSRKKGLIEAIKERFGDLIRPKKGFRREERFQPQEDSQRFANLVKECLIRFTPWESACVLPVNLEPDRNVIPQLLFEGQDPDQEHEIELNRIHTLIHPDCLARVVAALGLESPDQRLELPRFFVSGQDPRPINDRFNPAALTDGEVDAMTRYLNKNGRQRKQFSERSLSLIVDGSRHTEFAITPNREVNFDLGREPELIELRPAVSLDNGEDFPVTVALLEYNRFGVVPLNLLVPAGKRAFSLRLIPQMEDDSGVALGASLRLSEISRDENYGLTSWRDFRRWTLDKLKPHWPVLVPLAAVLIIAGSGILLRWSGHPGSSPGRDTEHVVQVSPPPQGPVLPNSPVVAPSGTPRSAPAQVNGRDKHIRGGSPFRENDNNGVRAIKPKTNSAQLRSVRAVYVDSLGADPASRELRENLIAQLRASNRFTVVTNRDDADAVFKGAVTTTPSNGAAVRLELVNARGQVVWSLPTSARGTTMPRDPSAGSKKIVQLLLREVSRSQRRR